MREIEVILFMLFLFSNCLWTEEGDRPAGSAVGADDDNILRRSLASHLTDSRIRCTDDGAHRAAGLLPRRHHFARPLPDTCSPNVVIYYLTRIIPACVCACVHFSLCLTFQWTWYSLVFIHRDRRVVASRWSFFVVFFLERKKGKRKKEANRSTGLMLRRW